MPKRYTGPKRRLQERRKGNETITKIDAKYTEWSIGTQAGEQIRDPSKNRRKNK